MVITIIHEWTKEQRTLEVTYYNDKVIHFYWPIAGTYELNLKTNTVKARSPQARRKHPFCLWRAFDIEAVRRQICVLLNPNHADVDIAYQKHQEWILAQGNTKCPTPKSSKRKTKS